MSLFRPMMYQKSIMDINYNAIKDMGIKVLVFDLDNTLSRVDEDYPDENTRKLLEKLKDKFRLVIASNSHQKRVNAFCHDLPCVSFHHVMKPSKKLYRQILKKHLAKKEEICIIGDQLLTDILFGNRVGIMTILVDKKGEKDLRITRFNRFFEKRIMRKINIERGHYYE